VRLVDIPADAGKGFGVFDNAGADGSSQTLADKMKAAAQAHYGTAGPEFVRKLIADNDLGKIKQMIESFRKNSPKDVDSQVLRVIDRFGLVAAAGELAIQFGVVRGPLAQRSRPPRTAATLGSMIVAAPAPART